MSKPKTMAVTVTVDTDELRHWAEKHADAGNHGVAHVLYKAASDGESLTEQAIRAAKVEALRDAADEMSSRLDTFAAGGRHTRARWAEGWLRDRAGLIEREASV